MRSCQLLSTCVRRRDHAAEARLAHGPRIVLHFLNQQLHNVEIAPAACSMQRRVEVYVWRVQRGRVGACAMQREERGAY